MNTIDWSISIQHSIGVDYVISRDLYYINTLKEVSTNAMCFYLILVMINEELSKNAAIQRSLNFKV